MTEEQRKKLFTEACMTVASFNLIEHKFNTIGLQFEAIGDKDSGFDRGHTYAVRTAVFTLGQFDILSAWTDKIFNQVMGITFDNFDSEVERIWQAYGKS